MSDQTNPTNVELDNALFDTDEYELETKDVESNTTLVEEETPLPYADQGAEEEAALKNEFEDPDFPFDESDAEEDLLREQSFTLSRAQFEPIPDGKGLRGFPLSLPYVAGRENLQELMASLQEKALEAGDEQLIANIGNLEAYLAQRNMLEVASDLSYQSLRGEEKEWLQLLKDGSRPVGARLSPYRAGKRNGNNFSFQSGLGLGCPVRVDLPLSCISLELSGFSPLNELSVANRVIDEYQARGLRTVGLSYRSLDNNITSVIVDYVLEHVTACTLAGWNRGDTATLKELIVPDDIEILLAMSRASAYPQGYPVVYQCTNALLGECTYKPTQARLPDGTLTDVSQRLKFDATVWYDRSRINAAHQETLSSKFYTLTKEQILAQQEKVAAASSNVIGPYETYASEIKTITIKLKHGNVAAMEEAARRWENQLKALVDEVMIRVTNPDPDVRAARRRQIRQTGERTISLLSDLPYVDSIILATDDGESYEITEQDDLQRNLEMVSGDAELTELIQSDIAKWRADTTLSMVAVANWKCPECGEAHRPVKDHPNGLVPYSALYAFFTLMGYQPRR